MIMTPKTLLSSVSVATRVFVSAGPHLHWRVIAARFVHCGRSGRNHLRPGSGFPESFLVGERRSFRQEPIRKVQYANIFGWWGNHWHVPECANFQNARWTQVRRQNALTNTQQNLLMKRAASVGASTSRRTDFPPCQAPHAQNHSKMHMQTLCLGHHVTTKSPQKTVDIHSLWPFASNQLCWYPASLRPQTKNLPVWIWTAMVRSGTKLWLYHDQKHVPRQRLGFHF